MRVLAVSALAMAFLSIASTGSANVMSRKTKANDPIIQVANGRTCIGRDSQISCWGNDFYGANLQASLYKNLRAIAMTEYTTCTLDDQGIFCAGEPNFVRVPPMSHPRLMSGNCFVDDSGLQCWSGTAVTPPVVLNNPREISGTGSPVCAIDDDGAHCWSIDENFQLAPAKIDVTLKNPSSLTSANGVICVLDENQLKCWGRDNGAGLLNLPEDIADPYEVSLGSNGACALHKSGASCWGSLWGIAIPQLKNPRRLAVTSSHACVVDDDGPLCWGAKGAPLQLPGAIVNPREIVAGVNIATTCAVHDDGVSCWGGTAATIVMPAFKNPKAVTVSDSSICVLDDSGVWCSNGSAGFRPKLKNPKVIGAGAERTCAIDDRGLICWGASNKDIEFKSAQFKNPRLLKMNDQNIFVVDDSGLRGWGVAGGVPLKVPSFGTIKFLEISQLHACGVDTNNLFCWKLTQVDPNEDKGQFDVIAGVKNARGLVVNTASTCVLNDGGLMCWGDLSLPTISEIPMGIARADQITMSRGYGFFAHVCAIVEAEVTCWGTNNQGQTNVPKAFW